MRAAWDAFVAVNWYCMALLGTFTFVRGVVRLMVDDVRRERES